MTMVPLFETGAVVIGYVGIVASWRRPKPQPAEQVRQYGSIPPMLIIQTCGGAEEGVYEPAASITLVGRERLLDLRRALDEALKEPT